MTFIQLENLTFIQLLLCSKVTGSMFKQRPPNYIKSKLYTQHHGDVPNKEEY